MRNNDNDNTRNRLIDQTLSLSLTLEPRSGIQAVQTDVFQDVVSIQTEPVNLNDPTNISALTQVAQEDLNAATAAALLGPAGHGDMASFVNTTLSSLPLASEAPRNIEAANRYLGDFYHAIRESTRTGSFVFPTVIPDPQNPYTARIIDHPIFEHFNATESLANRQTFIESIDARSLSTDAFQILVRNMEQIDDQTLTMILTATQVVVGSQLEIMRPISNLVLVFYGTRTNNTSTILGNVQTIIRDILSGRINPDQSFDAIFSDTSASIAAESASAVHDSGEMHESEGGRRRRNSGNDSQNRFWAELMRGFVIVTSVGAGVAILGTAAVFISRTDAVEAMGNSLLAAIRARREPALLPSSSGGSRASGALGSSGPSEGSGASGPGGDIIPFGDETNYVLSFFAIIGKIFEISGRFLLKVVEEEKKGKK